MTTTATFTLKQPIPEIPCRDVQKAVDFFCQTFGFQKPWVHEGYYGGIERDGMFIHFVKSEAAGTAMIYNYVEGVEGVWEIAQTSGIEIVNQIETKPYGMRDFTVKDLDGNQISFGQSMKEQA